MDREAELSKLNGAWSIVDDHHLSRHFKFDDFVSALAFVNRVGEVAEAQGHHPNIRFTYGQATIDIWTHDVKAITKADFDLARAIDKLV